MPISVWFQLPWLSSTVGEGFGVLFFLNLFVFASHVYGTIFASPPKNIRTENIILKPNQTETDEILEWILEKPKESKLNQYQIKIFRIPR